MGAFNLFDFGSELLSSVHASKALIALRNEHPKSFEIFSVLTDVCTESKLDFKTFGDPNSASVILRSEFLIKSIIDQPPFKCYAGIMPGPDVVFFRYLPSYGEFAVNSVDKYFLMNWINKRLTIGKVVVSEPYQVITGGTVQQLIYSIEINCNGVPPVGLDKVFINALNNILMFDDLFYTAISFLNESRIEIDAKDNFSGNKAEYVIQHLKKIYATSVPTISSESREQLSQHLIDLLARAGYNPEEAENREYYTITSPSHEGPAYSLQLYVNYHGQVVTQSYSPKITTSGYVIQMSDYLQFIHNHSSGNYYYDSENEFVIYRNSIDLRNIEKQFSGILITNLIKTHFESVFLYLPGFVYLKSEYDNPADILDNIVRGNPEFITTIQPNPYNLNSTNTSQPKDNDEQAITESQVSIDKAKMYTAPEANPTQKPSTLLKNRNTALLLEGGLGLLGFLGTGWLYSGKTLTGLLLLAGMFIWDIVALFTVLVTMGVGVICIIPIHIIFVGLSIIFLFNYSRNHPEIFKL